MAFYYNFTCALHMELGIFYKLRVEYDQACILWGVTSYLLFMVSEENTRNKV